MDFRRHLLVEVEIGGGAAGDQPGPTTERQVLDGLLDEKGETTAELHDVHQMDERPDQPGRHGFAGATRKPGVGESSASVEFRPLRGRVDDPRGRHRPGSDVQTPVDDPLSVLHVTSSSMCSDQMSDGGWRPGDVKPSNALLDGAITDDDAVMLP